MIDFQTSQNQTLLSRKTTDKGLEDHRDAQKIINASKALNEQTPYGQLVEGQRDAGSGPSSGSR